MVEAFLHLLFELLGGVACFALSIIGYIVGAPAVFLLSFGFLQPAPMSELNDSELRISKRMRWWHLCYRNENQLFLLADMVALIGLCLFALFVAFISIVVLSFLGWLPI